VQDVYTTFRDMENTPDGAASTGQPQVHEIKPLDTQRPKIRLDALAQLAGRLGGKDAARSIAPPANLRHSPIITRRRHSVRRGVSRGGSSGLS
jgi:hypothetical protein